MEERIREFTEEVVEFIQSVEQKLKKKNLKKRVKYLKRLMGFQREDQHVHYRDSRRTRRDKKG